MCVTPTLNFLHCPLPLTSFVRWYERVQHPSSPTFLYLIHYFQSRHTIHLVLWSKHIKSTYIYIDTYVETCLIVSVFNKYTVECHLLDVVPMKWCIKRKEVLLCSLTLNNATLSELYVDDFDCDDSIACDLFCSPFICILPKYIRP